MSMNKTCPISNLTFEERSDGIWITLASLRRVSGSADLSAVDRTSDRAGELRESVANPNKRRRRMAWTEAGPEAVGRAQRLLNGPPLARASLERKDSALYLA